MSTTDKSQKGDSVSAPVQPGPRPKCPKCHSGSIFIDWDKGTMGCNLCSFNGSCAQFFPVAVPSVSPRHTFILDVLPAKKLLALRDEIGELQAIAENHMHEEFDSCDVCGERGELRHKSHEYRQMAQDVAAHLADQIMFFAKLPLEQIESLRRRVPAVDVARALPLMEWLLDKFPEDLGNEIGTDDNTKYHECGDLVREMRERATTQGTPEGEC